MNTGIDRFQFFEKRSFRFKNEEEKTTKRSLFFLIKKLRSRF